MYLGLGNIDAAVYHQYVNEQNCPLVRGNKFNINAGFIVQNREWSRLNKAIKDSHLWQFECKILVLPDAAQH
jgi:hypothetical protein